MQTGNINYSQFSIISALSFKGEAEPAKAESAKAVSTPAQVVSESAKTTITSADTKKDEFVKTGEPQVVEKPKSSLTKKIAVGCVGLCPGLGQFVNGQWLKAVGFAVGVPAAATAGFFIGGYPGLAIASSIAYLWNIVDAVRNA